jgi:hypothetical protein
VPTNSRASNCGGCLVLLVAIGLIGKCVDKDGSREKTGAQGVKNTTRASGQHRIVSDKFIGCTSRDDNDLLTKLAVQGDTGAFQKALAAGLLTGRCTLFKHGEVVFVMDTAVLSGLVRIRRQGEVVEYWTNIEAID